MFRRGPIRWPPFLPRFPAPPRPAKCCPGLRRRSPGRKAVTGSRAPSRGSCRAASRSASRSPPFRNCCATTRPTPGSSPRTSRLACVKSSSALPLNSPPAWACPTRSRRSLPPVLPPWNRPPASGSASIPPIFLLELQLDPRFASALSPAAAAPVAPPPQFPPPLASTPDSGDRLEVLRHVELAVRLRFGGRRMLLKDILDLCAGSIVELDQQVQEPVELLLDGRVIALGEVVVVDGNYGLRVTEVPVHAGN